MQEMIEDDVYQDFDLPGWRKDRQARREDAAEAEIARLRALLKQQGEH